MKFSVLMSVYKDDNPLYLNQSIESIWIHQTLKPTQIVLVQDGVLTEALYGVVNKWKQKVGDSFTIVSLDRNMGLGAALNRGLLYCKYELVARMDSDDIALPDRFQIQVEYMIKNCEIIASSGYVEEWDEEMGTLLGIRYVPLETDSIIKMARFRSPLSHPASIFRRDIVLSLGGYPELRKAQDFALWSLLLKNKYKLSNLGTVLVKMRAGNSMIYRRGFSHLRYEMELLKYQRMIGFLPFGLFCVNFVLKAGLRLSPGFVKKIAYKFLR
ncbi:glycosyl transferase family protein [Escherichia coli]|uniref:Putative glycosyltransferase n=1 Tax=Escherichia coli TaxID=562 RepID=A0A0A8J423_ECOLX|nr:glycosyltransferase [Escherichia coli]EFF1817470.1 glycosyltransferase [Escherichia coli]ELQ9378389.1 glycosyltransferase [Escherichia coli]MCO0950233.1 glycosyltransferase [Escherichia coli]MDC8967208.1 glycosyltransferase [Escherichia coli]MDD8420501.1 glycosyltransferase [Escherichia coli]